jgi:plastocyanin
MKRPTLVLAAATAMLLVAGPVAVLSAPGDPSVPSAQATAMTMGSISLLAPASGTLVTGNTVDVKVAVKDFTLSCPMAGKPVRPGVGHWHLLLDGALVNMYCGSGAALTLQNVAPGKHTVAAVLAGDNHMDMMGKEQMATTTFTYRPATPLPALTAYRAAGKPTITILSPASGAAVGENFPVELNWSYFMPSCDLLGKKDLAGYGHWHLNIDSMSGPMMGMGTMLAMGCTHTATVFADGLRPGKHILYALLVDNQHAPLMPPVASSVTINVLAAAAQPATAMQTVMIVDDGQTVGRFAPNAVHLTVGQSVLFKNVSGAVHTVTADNSVFDSGNISPGVSWRFTATKAGTFAYHCIYHPLMHGTIVISA